MRECDRLGIPVEIDAAEGLLRSIAVANGNIIFYQALVNELPIHPGPDTFVMTGDGGYWERGAPGLYGRTYHVSGVPTGEAKESILVQMLDKERTRFEALCIAALKLNLDERQIEAAKAIGEAQAQMVAALIRAIFGDPQLGLSADQVRVALGVAAQHLRGLSQPGLTAG